MEAWAKEHGVRPNLNSVGRRVNRGFDQPMTRLEKYKLDKMYSDLEEREFASRRQVKKLGNYILDAEVSGRKLSPRAKGFVKRVATSGNTLKDIPDMTAVKKQAQ